MTKIRYFRESDKCCFLRSSMAKFLVAGTLFLSIESSVYAQSTQDPFKFSGKIESLFSKLEKDYGYTFFFYDGLINKKQSVKIDLKNSDISTIMRAVLNNSALSFEIKNKQIIITEAKDSKQAGTRKESVLKGVVVDATGEPLMGVNVTVPGTTIGTTTGLDGDYSIKVPAGSMLSFTYIGYQPKTLSSNDPSKLSRVLLGENTEVLDDIVVVGYTTKSREKLISSVSTVKSDELVKASVPNLEGALAGRVSGVFSRQSTGEPGKDGANIQIRGFGSALVVVDGIPGREYSSIDPSEIESISILKDASASAVYGMQGANGVILVTTKRGQKNKKATVDVSARFGVQQPTNYVEPASTHLWQTLGNEYTANMKLAADRNAVITPEDMLMRDYAFNTNWYDVMIKNAFTSQANLNISGGSDKINYFVSAGALFQDGIWATKSTNRTRYNARANVDVDIVENLKLSAGFGAIFNNLDYPATGSETIARELKNTGPNIPVRWPGNDTYYAFGGEGTVNPMALADKNVSGYSKSNNKNLNLDISLNYKIKQVEGLSLKGTLGYTSYDSWSKAWTKNIPYIGYRQDDDSYYESASASNTNKASLGIGDGVNYNLTWQGFINYANSFAEHSVNGGLVFEGSQAKNRSTYTSRGEFPSTVIDMLPGGNAAKQISNSEGLREYRTASLIGRFSYDFATKYFLDFNFRYDGAQYFADKWGFFPSASVGWLMTKESFMQSLTPVLKEFKWRASYGELGDLSAAKNYYAWNDQYYFQEGYKYPGPSIVIGDREIYGLTPTIMANPDFTWSTSTMLNAGFDFNLWNSLLSGSFDYFYRERKGLPAKKANDNSGVLATWYNLNADNSRGFEIALNHENKVGEFSYFINTNLSWSRSKNGRLEHGQFTNGLGEWKWNGEYHWKNVNWGYKYIGHYVSYEDIANAPMHDKSNGNSILLPGDLKYEDWNGDGYIDEHDQRPISRGNYPEIVGGVNMGFEWKGFDFQMFWQGAAKSNFSLTAFDMDAFGEGRLFKNTWAYFGDRWHKADYTDPNSPWIPGHFPAIREMEQNPVNRLGSDFWQFSGNYLRLKNIEVGYNLPKNVMRKIGMEQFRIYANLQNFFTIRGQKFFDPEMAAGSSYSLASYPQIRSFNIGLNVKF